MALQDRTRSRIERLASGPDGESRYFHPRGYVIERERRTWSERTGRVHGQADPPPPLVWWSVYKHVAAYGVDVDRYHRWARRGREEVQCDTLREAREWCDEHPRDGWS